GLSLILGWMIWGALLGGLIGAGIPGWLTYVGLRRGRLASDAAVFGPARVLLGRMNPDAVMFNFSNDRDTELSKWADLARQVDAARQGLLTVAAGHPRRGVRRGAEVVERKISAIQVAFGWQVSDMLRNHDNPEWLKHYREVYAEADKALRDLIEA